MCEYHRAHQHTRELEVCYSIKENEPKEEDDLRNIKIQELKAYKEIQEPNLSETILEYLKPMKTTKENIGTEENPKLDIIGYYWDEETISQIVDLLKEYQDLFPNSFSEMKGIERELGEMKIPLKSDVKPVK